ncbi:hypothetical protein [Dactylosporangium sp. CA-139066]|uniref:hypothetical protein n=1 Tax=Dactylosporangium sp. CA-139066 TaxID=3239930 RepID=UPI003D8AC152
MDIDLSFIASTDGQPRQSFALDVTGPAVLLPALVIANRSNRALLVRSIVVRPIDPGAPAAAARLGAEWAPVIPGPGLDLAGHGRYRAPWKQVPVAALPPGTTEFVWMVEAAVRLPDGRLQPGTPVYGRCVLSVPQAGAAPSVVPEPVVVAPEPVAVAPEPVLVVEAPPAADEEPAEELHDGWLAIDFGMSNSTITMFDQNQKRALIGIAPTQAAVLRDRLTDLLDGTAADTFGLPAERWRQALESAGRALSAGRPGDPLVRLKESLAGDGLFDVLLALDLDMHAAMPAERDAMAGALQRLYHEAFACPPLEEMQLFPVPLHAGERTISSDARILGLDPLQLTLHADGDADAHGEVPLAARHQPGLKRFVGTTRPLPGLPDGREQPTAGEALIALWRCLLDKVDRFRSDHGERFAAGRITRAVVTYPTTAPPQTRLDMEELAASVGLTIVDTRFDEATAAAMFSLMREFGGDHAVGIEAFRARSRPVGPGVWHYNTLVIDIGGGSTDVALLGLTLRDRTELDAGVPPERQGRFYELRPTVLGKAGDLQLGGDRITLGIFHLIKATIADRLLTVMADRVNFEQPPFIVNGRYVPGSLLAATAGPDAEDGNSRALVIDRAVPTRWALAHGESDTRAARERFDRLWAEAERAKRASVGGGPFVMRHVGDVLQLPVPAAAIGPIEIPVAAVRAEVEKVVRRSMEIGREVARHRLPVADAGGQEPLDAVILSGGTAALPQVRELLHDVFTGEADADEGSLGWNPLRVVHDQAYAKLGTSIGACWAEYVLQKGFLDARSAKEHVAMGRTELLIDVENLLHGLPYGLELAVQGPSRPVFPAGQEFDRIGEDGRGALRSGWMSVVKDLKLHRQRYIEHGDRPNDGWGHLSLDRLADADSGPRRVDLDDWVRRVQVQFEIDERDMLKAHFCSGPPRFDLDMTTGRPDPHLIGPAHPGGPPLLRHDLLVNPDAAGGLANHGTTVLARGAEPNGSIQSPDSPAPLRCWESTRFPRDTPADGTWWIGRRDADNPELLHRVGGAVPAGIQHGRGADTRLVVDERGRVRAVRGFVPYLQARHMADVVDRPGSVLSVPMKPGSMDLDKQFDPFTGRQ